jgi:hypothetical protein
LRTIPANPLEAAPTTIRLSMGSFPADSLQSICALSQPTPWKPLPPPFGSLWEAFRLIYLKHLRTIPANPPGGAPTTNRLSLTYQAATICCVLNATANRYAPDVTAYVRGSGILPRFRLLGRRKPPPEPDHLNSRRLPYFCNQTTTPTTCKTSTDIRENLSPNPREPDYSVYTKSPESDLHPHV